MQESATIVHLHIHVQMMRSGGLSAHCQHYNSFPKKKCFHLKPHIDFQLEMLEIHRLRIFSSYTSGETYQEVKQKLY